MPKLVSFFSYPNLGFFWSRISYLISCHDLLLSERKGIHFSWKVDDFLKIGRRRWHISRMRRLVLPFKWKIGGRRWRISRVWRLVLTFKWTYFPNAGPRECLSTLKSWQGMEGRILSSRESIRQHLLTKTSP